MKNPPTNTDDIIDSRDIIERTKELKAEIEDAGKDADTDDIEELKALTELTEEASGSSDWQLGETLVRDSYFTEYAQELAEDCCNMPNAHQWPHCCIDWERAASELKMDYTCVDFDGVEYWIRA